MGKEEARSFVLSNENIIKTQESNILGAFLGLESISEMTKEFKNYYVNLNDYSAKTMSDKQELIKKICEHNCI